MLEELIMKYEIAMRVHDDGTMRLVEAQLRSVGIDKRSLLDIVEERRNNCERKA